MQKDTPPIINDIARRMYKIMHLLPAEKGTAVLTDEAYNQLDDKDFTVLWYMPIQIVTTVRILRDIKRRARILDLKDTRKMEVRRENLQSN